jgi:hypothetical protein
MNISSQQHYIKRVLLICNPAIHTFSSNILLGNTLYYGIKCLLFPLTEYNCQSFSSKIEHSFIKKAARAFNLIYLFHLLFLSFHCILIQSKKACI